MYNNFYEKKINKEEDSFENYSNNGKNKNCFWVKISQKVGIFAFRIFGIINFNIFLENSITIVD